MRIGLVGGTGREGRGLAQRWARAGHEVAIGSRDPARAAARAAELGAAIRGAGNAAVAAGAEVVVLCVPYAGHTEMLAGLRAELAGKVLVDITVPLAPPAFTRVHLPPGKAAALEAQALLPESRVVAALHHVSSAYLADLDRAIDTDVLVCGDDEAAREVFIRLVGDLGMRGLDAGALANAVALEAMTPVLLHLNRRYKTNAIGLRITGLP